MEKLKMHTPDLAEENYKKLAELFPNAVTETKDEEGNTVRAIDADVLRQEISATVVEGDQERYQFTWPDKRKSIVLANAPIAKTLRFEKEKSVGRDGTSGGTDSENIYIEGDNLDALKLLQETYLGKVKMIYIDPPYNTGNDFIYEDDFSQSVNDYANNSGQTDEEGNRLVQNSDSNGRFHTDWLNMLYPRLRIAKDLLTSDGVIFISIDDNEYGDLRKICDEVFGAQSFLATFVWKRRASSQLDKSKCSTDHEYVLAYKGKDFSALRGIDKDYRGYSNPDNDPRGPWTPGDLTVGMTGDMRPNQYYDLIDPKTGKVYKPNYNRVWSYIPESMNQLIEENRIVFPEDTSKRPMRKRFASELDSSTNPQSTWMDCVGMNTEGTKQMYDLFGKTFFPYTKPVSLIKSIILQATEKNSVVLDFFSGSATTAQAVMQLNAEDAGKRNFIMVQLQEDTGNNSEAYKDGFKNICDVGEERIRRAGKKIKEETGADIDYGFRCFKVDSTNMEDVFQRPADLAQDQLSLFDSNIKQDRTPEDLLVQVMLDLGVLLSSKIEEIDIKGKRVFSVSDGYLLACFDENIDEDVVTEIAQKKPYYAVFRDSSMADDSVAANFEQIFATYSPQTVRKVL
ncbi:site-specific DNA-methyltransferase [Baileyella intestinalis]|uniref:site-specific DNA-methyltransferase n=1 Tax=Baileyella intestinalis TaxID=2606709 RepID=UPI0022E258A5|nr:site-specific DNA-methyltransferase [Baileyella intestinalis]